MILLIMWSIGCSDNGTEPPVEEFALEVLSTVEVTKTNSTKLYMHYMPWFESEEVNGYWGSHWKMRTRDPNVVDGDGKREIASHFYPLIGPYASKDPDVIEYHLLLMKLSGIDGLLIDWYGTFDVNDYRQNLTNSNTLIDQIDDAGLDFGIVYEEYTAENVANNGSASNAIAAAQEDLSYMENNYFSQSNYINVGSNPLLLTFGPRYFKTENEWTQIFSNISSDPVFLTLDGQINDVGSNGDGEFTWPFRDHLSDLDDFYNNRAPNFSTAIAAAYPGFYDYYEEGGYGDIIGWQIAYRGTGTLSATLERASTSGLPIIQLVTWNDFGEGTMFEPTDEFGYSFLEVVQDFAGVPYSVQDLELVYDLYQKRKAHKSDSQIQVKLNQVYYYLIALRIENARTMLNSIE